MILSIAKNWSDAEAEHDLYLSNLLKKYLLACQGFCGPKVIAESAAYYFIKDAEKLVMSHDRKDFLLSIGHYNRVKAGLGVATELFVTTVEKVFNYKRFTTKGPGWNAYALCRKSNARICPYCNHAYAFTVQSENGDFRPTLDHFYYKDEYPHLALSLYNLVPSCSSCNSSLKGQADFAQIPHLNPLFDAENIQFYLSIDGDPSELVEAVQSRRADVLVKAKAIRPSPESAHSLKTFVINERYETLSVEAIDFYLAKKNYDEAALNTQFTFAIDEITSLRFDRACYSNYLLGKMYADIYDAFKK